MHGGPWYDRAVARGMGEVQSNFLNEVTTAEHAWHAWHIAASIGREGLSMLLCAWKQKAMQTIN